MRCGPKKKKRRRKKNGHPCLVPDLLRRNALSFALLGIMLTLGLSNKIFIMLRCIPSISTLLRVLIINGYWILWKVFSASIKMIMWFLFFNVLTCCVTLVYLWILNHSDIPGTDKSHSIMVYDPFNVLLNSAC